VALYVESNRRLFRSLGAWLKQARIRRGLTLDEVVKLASISKPYLSYLENDKTPGPPSNDVIERLATVLEVNRGEMQLLAHLLSTPGDVLRLIPSERLDRFRRQEKEEVAGG
jgi:transcriptional regulator with XRE-family HTH domain